MYMIKLEDYYFHSIINDNRNALNTLDGIFMKGSIMSPHELGVKKRYGCHKSNEICFTTKKKNPNIKLFNSCFDLFVDRLVTIMIDPSFIKEETIVNPIIVSTDLHIQLDNLGKLDSNIFTNLYDELRTTGNIPVEGIKGICLPYDGLINDVIKYITFTDFNQLIDFYTGNMTEILMNFLRLFHSSEEELIKRKNDIDNYINVLKWLINSYGLDIPVYNFTIDRELKLIK